MMDITKRQKFVLVAFVLSLGFLGINLLDERYRFFIIGGLTVSTLLLFAWSLREGLGLNATLFTLILPTLFTLGVGLFWFLLPATIFARLPIVFLYGLGIYALLLTLNIYTVSAIRTIALARAARGVGFVLTLLVSFLLFDAILSVRGNLFFVGVTIVVTSFLLFLQGLWTCVLEHEISKKLIWYSTCLTLAILEASVMLFFWPVTVVVGSLFLTVIIYMLLGLAQAQLEGKLFGRNARDYLTVGFFVFVAMFFATHWGA